MSDDKQGKHGKLGNHGTDEARWALAGSWSKAEHLTELETTMWRSERHPQQSSTICVLAVLGSAPDWDRLVAAHAWAADLVPRVRQRIVDPALPTGTPAWEVDPHFSLDYHLRRQQLGARNDLDDLLELAQTLVLTPFDRHRPLWEVTLIDGLEGDRAAYLLKVHHSLADGLGMVQLLNALASRTPEHTADKLTTPPDDPAWGQARDPWTLALDGVASTVRDSAGLLGGAVMGAAKALRDPLDSAGSGQRYLASLRRMLAPEDLPAGSALLRPRDGRRWTLRTLECSLADLRRAGRSVGGSVNDAYLAALCGGLRRYHEAHGVEVGDLPVTVPVSLRRSDDPMGGNAFAGVVLPAPVGVVDAAERIATIRGLVLSATNEPALDTFSVLAPVVNRLPAVVGSATMRLGARSDMAASNVPGLTEQVYLAGARVERIIPFGPLPGVALMAVMTSYAGRCDIGLTIDGSVIDDPDVLLECFEAGLAEVVAL